MPPSVSVIVPTYNRADLVSEAIDSVLRQTHADLEAIVVDDGSSDDTSDVVSGYRDPRVVSVRIEHSGLVGVARNVGLEHARGELIAFLDSDDAWLPDRLERTLAELRGTVGVVCSNAQIMDETGASTGALYLDADPHARGRAFQRLIEKDNFVITSTVLTRRKLLDRVGYFPELQLLRGVEDYDLWLRLALITDFVYIPAPLVRYRRHVGSMNEGADIPTHWQALVCIMDRTEGELAGRGYRGWAARQMVRRRRNALLAALGADVRQPLTLSNALRRARTRLRHILSR